MDACVNLRALCPSPLAVCTSHSARRSLISRPGLRLRAAHRDYSFESAPKNIELPNGTWWLDKASHSHDVVYGQNFVLQRPPRGGPGLVLSPRLSPLQVVREGETSGLTVLEGLAGDGQAWDMAAADYCLSSVDETLAPTYPRLLPGGTLPQSTSTGIILHPDSASQQEGQDPPVVPDHPRRKQRVRFTCNLCGETNTKPVNPHAWSEGAVFARCDGCQVIHKLTDNLKLFHELKGPVFNTLTPTEAAEIKIPPGLPQQPGMTHHVHPAVWPLLQDDAQE